MQRFPRLRVSKDVLLVLALVGLIVQLVAFSGARDAVAEHVLPHIQQVLITNTTADPVPVTGSVSVKGGVTVTNYPALQPFQQRHSFQWENGMPATVTKSFVVPAGILLVIEAVSADFAVESGVDPYQLAVTTTGGEYAGSHQLSPSLEGTFAATSIWYLHELTTLYADPGSTVDLHAARTPDGTGDFRVTIIGHLVNVP